MQTRRPGKGEGDSKDTYDCINLQLRRGSVVRGQEAPRLRPLVGVQRRYPTGVMKSLARRLLRWLTLVGFPYWTLCLSSSSSARLSPPPIPITVISGFLGAGKTTLLQNLLQNKEGLRIAVVVNDVAAVNIDSKQLAAVSSNPDQQQAAGMVELQNGCACCSQSEELLASVAELVTLSDLKDEEDAFDHIVIECSGVADPKGVRAQFQEAALYQMPLLERVQLDTMVTLIDGASYLDYLQSDKMASPDETPELYYRDGERPAEDDELDDAHIPEGLRALLGQNSPAATEESVAALLISQTETADVILLNKVDLAAPVDLNRIEAVVRACGSSPRVQRTTYAAVDWRDILGVAQGRGVVLSGIVDDHRDAVQDALSTAGDQHKDHSKDHACEDPGCTDPSHDHDHGHSHGHKQEAHGAHSHDHKDHACDDADCTDPSHSHGSTSTTHAGIATFVYRARRPFHPERLLSFLHRLPIRMGLPLAPPATQEASRDDAILSQILRSKGFCWCADSHRVAYFWSQAGPSFELNKVGAWWATLPREQWPPSAEASILADFDSEHHDESNLDSMGDRRQELVLIGQSVGQAPNQALLQECLDDCLLQDDEWQDYLQSRHDEGALRSKFPTSISSRIMSY
jgi:G3E family GTPase